MIHRLIGYNARRSRQRPAIRLWPNPAVELSISVHQVEKLAHCHHRQQTTQSDGMDSPRGHVSAKLAFSQSGARPGRHTLAASTWYRPAGRIGSFGYPFVIALLIACGVAPLWYFRCRGWLEHAKDLAAAAVAIKICHDRRFPYQSLDHRQARHRWAPNRQF